MSFGGFLGLAHSHYPIRGQLSAMTRRLDGFRTQITEAQGYATRPTFRMIPGRIARGRRRRTSITAPPVTGIDVKVLQLVPTASRFSITSAMWHQVYG